MPPTDTTVATDLPGTPWLGLLALCLALGSVWWGLRWLGSRWGARGWARLLLGVAGAGVLTGALWAGFTLLGRGFPFSSSWPTLVVALIGAVSAEILLWLYELERGIVTSRRGFWLMALRLSALAVLLFILLQPAHTYLVTREISREVAILVDDSESMHISDSRLTPLEQLDRALVLGVPAALKRPALASLRSHLGTFRDRLASEVAAFQDTPTPEVALAARGETLTGVLTEMETEARTLSDEAKSLLEAHRNLPGEVTGPVGGMRDRLAGEVARWLAEARSAIGNKDAKTVPDRLNSSLGVVSPFLVSFTGLEEKTAAAYVSGLPESDRKAIAEAAGRPRADAAKGALVFPVPGKGTGDAAKPAPLLDQLAADYNVRLYHFARGPEEAVMEKAQNGKDHSIGEPVFANDEARNTFRSLTNLDSALKHVIDQTSPESLAGVLLLSDGRHNAETLPEDALRTLGGRHSPLISVPVGSHEGPTDAAILNLTAPESIFLGDRSGIRVEVKLDNLRGRKVKAILRRGGQTVQEQEIDVPDVDYRTELRFADRPDEKGIYDYQVELVPQEGEIFEMNNRWDFKTAVTDDRTNVLLVDGYPRWEFRYLRNLFYGRDKSVHLQYVLMDPDRIEGQRSPPTVAASATRPFGDAEATELPANADEWRLFDVIILGDLPPATIDERTWTQISEAVTKRGALLVVSSGPRYMPHAHPSKTLRELLPATFAEESSPRLESPEAAYKVALTQTGMTHPVMAQSTSRALNLEIWNQMPELRWRTTVTGIKEGAEVLAYAQPVGSRADVGSPGAVNSPGAVEEALRRLADRKSFERDHALVVSQRAGLGKVLLLNFDNTWRFRFGVGDTYHHRFWGQILRWGAGETLRSGSDTLRLGTDRLTYTIVDPLKITAKVLDKEHLPVRNAEVSAVILDNAGRHVSRLKLTYRPESNGLYDAISPPLAEPGEYTVRLEGDAAARETSPVETSLVVMSTRSPLEFAELTANRDLLGHAASVTGGRVVELSDLADLVGAFGKPKESLTERHNISLWDKWPLLVLFLGLVTTEWILRRRGGLS